MTVRLPDEATEDALLATLRGRLLDAVAAERTPRLDRVRRPVALIAAAGLVAAITGGTIAVVQATHEQIAFSARCYPTASLAGPTVDVGRPPAVEIATGQDAERHPLDPVAICGDMWRMGLIGQEVAPDDPNSARFPVPPLVGCTLPDGVGAAFPREDSTAADADFCRALGLGAWAD